MNKRKIGAEYEKRAARYLEERGCRILEQNYRNRFGELDLIAEQDGTLVFAEVKFRSTGAHGSPLEAVDARKQKKICRTAFYYYAGHGYAEGMPCRFDVVAISGDGTVEHIENAFEFRY